MRARPILRTILRFNLIELVANWLTELVEVGGSVDQDAIWTQPRFTVRKSGASSLQVPVFDIHFCKVFRSHCFPHFCSRPKTFDYSTVCRVLGSPGNARTVYMILISIWPLQLQQSGAVHFKAKIICLFTVKIASWTAVGIIMPFTLYFESDTDSDNLDPPLF